jgi:hypothetical protein
VLALRLGPTAGFDGLCDGVGGITYESIELTRTAAGVAGQVKGTAEYIRGDVLVALPFIGTLTGVPDRTAPSASFGAGPQHPVDRAILRFTEALAEGTRASLVGPDGTAIPLAGDAAGAFPAWFSTRRPLRAGASYRVKVEPGFVDLAGNAGNAAALPILTTTDVPLLPEDGFEGTTAPLLAGGASVVGAPDISPLSGARSLLFPPRALTTNFQVRFTARLAVAAADRTVKATVRMYVGGDRRWRDAQTRVTVSTLDGMTSAVKLPAAVDPLTCDPANPQGPCFSDPVTLELPLPGTGAGQVLIDIDRVLRCGLPPPPEPGFLLDDLRVE